MSMRIPLLLIAAIMVLVVAGCTNNYQITTDQGVVCIRESCFQVEIVDTPEERATGLMFREELAQDRGMLFIFEDDGIHDFWMKNTKIPLDIIWISQDMVVVYISRDTRPCRADPCPSVNPEKIARYVLEVNAGISDSAGIEVGDKATFDLR